MKHLLSVLVLSGLLAGLAFTVAPLRDSTRPLGPSGGRARGESGGCELPRGAIVWARRVLADYRALDKTIDKLFGSRPTPEDVLARGELNRTMAKQATRLRKDAAGAQKALEQEGPASEAFVLVQEGMLTNLVVLESWGKRLATMSKEIREVLASVALGEPVDWKPLLREFAEWKAAKKKVAAGLGEIDRMLVGIPDPIEGDWSFQGGIVRVTRTGLFDFTGFLVQDYVERCSFFNDRREWAISSYGKRYKGRVALHGYFSFDTQEWYEPCEYEVAQGEATWQFTDAEHTTAQICVKDPNVPRWILLPYAYSCANTITRVL